VKSRQGTKVLIPCRRNAPVAHRSDGIDKYAISVHRWLAVLLWDTPTSVSQYVPRILHIFCAVMSRVWRLIYSWLYNIEMPQSTVQNLLWTIHIYPVGQEISCFENRISYQQTHTYGSHPKLIKVRSHHHNILIKIHLNNVFSYTSVFSNFCVLQQKFCRYFIFLPCYPLFYMTCSHFSLI